MIKKYWFFTGMACVIGIAFTLPDVGRFVRTYKILNIGIFMAFFLTGLSLETSSFFEQLKNIKVLVPLVIGQCLRPRLKSKIVPFSKAISIFNQSIVLMIILNAVSSSTHRILEAGAALFLVFLFMIGLHIFIILANKTTAGIIGLDLPSTAAFTIHTSQKTLTISYLVWAGYFATVYPMALIPGIAYHLEVLE